jgi:L-seryl-tRNA(Ser) seleniumtransferase
MIAASAASLEQRARHWQEEAAARGLEVDLQPGESPVGGGSLPGETLPTTLLALPRSVSAEALRRGAVPVVGVTRGQRVLLDLRTVPPDQDEALLDAVCVAARAGVVDSCTR